MSQSTPEVNYFNLHTSGLGYLSRIRRVDVKRGDGFLACEINALHGRSNEVEYTRFDCRVSGSLTIREILGRHGPFKVGKLFTQLGEFSVKDALLDQYEPGTYEGNFGIGRIYPSYYVAGGRIIVEVRASVENMVLSGIDDQLPEEPVFTEPDPMDMESVNTDDSPALEASSTSSDSDAGDTRDDDRNAHDANEPESDLDSDAALFGSLMPLADSVKLDPTVKRAVLRVQCDRLKALGLAMRMMTVKSLKFVQ